MLSKERRQQKRRPALEALEPRRVLAAYISQCLVRPETGHEYFLLRGDSDGLTWTDAEAAAQLLDSHLSTIHDQRELDWLTAADLDAFYLWLGLNADNEGTLTWADGSPSAFHNSLATERIDDEYYVALVNSEDEGHRWEVFADIASRDGFAFAALAERGHQRPWHNEESPRDIDHDSTIAPIDALEIINDLNANGSRLLPDAPADSTASRLAIDVNADGFSSPIDALEIINYLNNPDNFESERSDHEYIDCTPVFSLTEQLVQEGATYELAVVRPATEHPFQLRLEFDGEPVHQYDPITVLGDANIELAMPNVLGLRPPEQRASDRDGYTLRITNGLYRAQLPLTVREGLRIEVNATTAYDGGDVPIQIRNGIAESPVLVALHYDGTEISRQSFETDSGGFLETTFPIERHTILYPQTEDRFDLVVSHADSTISHPLLIQSALQVWTSTTIVREGYEFTIGGRTAASEALVATSILLDDVETDLLDNLADPDGTFSLTYTMPDVIQNEAATADATILVRTTDSISDKQELFEFPLLVQAGAVFTLRDDEVMEGDFYYVDAVRPASHQPVELALEHNSAIVYEYDDFSVTGDTELRIVMPEVLPFRPAEERGSDRDGYTLIITNGPYTERLSLVVREGLRITVDKVDVREGGRIPFHIRNGIGESEVIADLLHDGNIVQTRRYDTDGSGLLRTEFQLERHLLEYPSTEDGFALRLTHGGKSVTTPLTVRHGLQVWTSSKNIREGHDFTIGGRGAVGETAVYVDVRIDGREYNLTDPKKDTNSDGSIDVTYTMPKIITTGADRDGAIIVVRTGTAYNENPDRSGEESFEFRVTVHKGHHEEPEQESYPEGITLPTLVLDNSLSGLVASAVLGATDEQLRSLVPATIATKPDFLPIIRGHVKQHGRHHAPGATQPRLLDFLIPSAHAATYPVANRPIVNKTVWDEVVGSLLSRWRAWWNKEDGMAETSIVQASRNSNVIGCRPGGGYDDHLGHDCMIPADEAVWSPVPGRIHRIHLKDSQFEATYGTMAVVVEVKLPEQREFIYEDGAKRQTHRLWVTFGHLRPSPQQILDPNPEARYQGGRSSPDSIEYEQEGWISSGELLGYIENWGPSDDNRTCFSDNDCFKNLDGSYRYFGSASGPHLHITIADATKTSSVDDMLKGSRAKAPNIAWYIKPDDAWDKLSDALTYWQS